MTFPAGVTLVPVKWGPFMTASGARPSRVTVQILPKTDGGALVWSDTGETMNAIAATVNGADEVDFLLPAVDQVGWIDRSGAAVVQWYYQAVARITYDFGVEELVKNFQVLESTTLLDLAKVPDGPALDPVVAPFPQVLTVNGLSGHVVIPQVVGKSAYELAVEGGFAGTEAEWLDALSGEDGSDGKSAYEVAVGNGFVGDEQAWLASLSSVVPGPANALAIGTVIEGTSPAASITGSSPNQTLNLVLPAADPGPSGPSGDIGQVVSLGNQSGALNLTSLVLDSQFVTLTAVGNLTLAAANMPSVPAGLGGSFSIRVKQDATGSRTLTTTGIKYAYGVAPVLTTAANAVDLLTFSFDGVEWCGFVSAASLA